jgi:hypothetical protein
MDHSLPHGSADERRSEAAPPAFIFDPFGAIHDLARDARDGAGSAELQHLPKPDELSPEVIRAWAT